jgi:hypothetical protein
LSVLPRRTERKQEPGFVVHNQMGTVVAANLVEERAVPG